MIFSKHEHISFPLRGFIYNEVKFTNQVKAVIEKTDLQIAHSTRLEVKGFDI